MKKIGNFGEELVTQWLESQGWEILQRRWHSPWGEIDVIASAREMQMLIFVEVKTRSRKNWDEGGIYAISRKKQEKLWLTAQTFLSHYPDLALLPCRFDVALVSHKKIALPISPSQGHHSFYREEYQFTLDNYLESAFILEG